MFIGEYSHSIDDKGRVSLPIKFRGSLADGCVVTRGLDHCLWIYPANRWQEMAQKIAELPLTQKNARSFARLMLAGAVEDNADKAGRINIPGYLKAYAGLKNKVVITGVYDRIEIWPEDKWSDFKKGMEENSDEIAENLVELGF